MVVYTARLQAVYTAVFGPCARPVNGRVAVYTSRVLQYCVYGLYTARVHGRVRAVYTVHDVRVHGRVWTVYTAVYGPHTRPCMGRVHGPCVYTGRVHGLSNLSSLTCTFLGGRLTPGGWASCPSRGVKRPL